MGLFDFLTSQNSASGEAPVGGMSGLMGKLNYGGVPFGIRLMAAAEALRTINNPNISRPALALLARAKEKYDDNRLAAEEAAKREEKANRLADKLQLTNPEIAEIIRANPDLVDEYGKGSIADTFETRRYGRNRADQLEDRDFNAGLQREGWGVQQDLQNDRQEFEVSKIQMEAELEKEKLKAQQAYDEAMRQGRIAEAKMIADGFFAETGTNLDVPGAGAVNSVPSAPGPQDIPAPVSTSIAPQQPTPRYVPGLTRPPSVKDQSSVGQMPEEEGDAEPARPAEVQAWAGYFKDAQLTPTEAAMLSASFKATLSESMQAGKDPDKNLALGAAAETYKKILEARAEQQTADAATSEAETKAQETILKKRMEQATTSEKTILSAEGNAQTADNVLTAIEKAKVAADPKNADYLPATGAGSGLAAYVGDTDYTGNARAIFSAVNTVKANLGFAELKKMRDESPTGGALGQVAVQELEMLQSTVASLDQTEPNFKDNLAQVEELYKRIKQRNSDYAEDIKNLRKFPSAAHKREFDEMYGVDAHLKFVGE